MSNKELNITENVMNEIKSGKAKMKSRWYFLLGSIVVVFGISFLTATIVFLVNLTFSSLRAHGPMGGVRYEQMISNFPWWIPVLAILGLIFGVWILKKFDFSYKKNFLLITLGFILAIILMGWFVDYLGFNNIMKRGHMRGLYQQQNGGETRNQSWKN